MTSCTPDSLRATSEHKIAVQPEPSSVVAVGISMGIVMHGFGEGSPRYLADVVELDRLGGGGVSWQAFR
jgi:hypothetical protein